jgi:dTDP-4-dehydrorhamnose 3,5-epimerase-like enzyme
MECLREERAVLHSVRDVAEIRFPQFKEEGGALAVYQSFDGVPFLIRRVFCVTAPAGAVRGRHAHRQCAQLLVAVSGRIGLSCTDGQQSRSFALAEMGMGVLIPPSIWAEQLYEDEKSVLMVVCDRPYDAEDYIRSFEEFLAFRRLG